MPKLVAPSSVDNAFDRTRSIFDAPDVVPIAPVGRFCTPKLLADICDERAQQIISTAAGRKIYVYWSGGIDSTAVMCALIKQSAPNLVVVMNDASIAEYPLFYDKFIKDKIIIEHRKIGTHSSLIPKPVDAYFSDGVVVTGELGDQMFGSGKYSDSPDGEKLLRPWKENFSNLNVISKFEALAMAAPIPIVTLKEFWWWFSYAVKYNFVAFRMLRTSYKFKFDENIFHFFGCQDFNDWAVSTPMEVRYHGTDLKKYKQPLKDYIYSVTGDSEYQINKCKEGSLHSVIDTINPIVSEISWNNVTTDWVFSK